MGLGRSYLDYIEECVDDALGDLAGKLAAEFWLSAITPWATIEAPSLCPKHPKACARQGTSQEKALWECEKGHKWRARAAHVLYGQSWCSECLGRKRKTLKDMRTIELYASELQSIWLGNSRRDKPGQPPGRTDSPRDSSDGWIGACRLLWSG